MIKALDIAMTSISLVRLPECGYWYSGVDDRALKWYIGHMNPLDVEMKEKVAEEHRNLCKSRYADGTPLNHLLDGSMVMVGDRAWTLLNKTAKLPMETIQVFRSALLQAYENQERLLAEMEDLKAEIIKLRNEKVVYLDNPGPIA